MALIQFGALRHPFREAVSRVLWIERLRLKASLMYARVITAASCSSINARGGLQLQRHQCTRRDKYRCKNAAFVHLVREARRNVCQMCLVTTSAQCPRRWFRVPGDERGYVSSAGVARPLL